MQLWVDAAVATLGSSGGGGDSGSRDVAGHLRGHDPRRAPSADALLSTAAPGLVSLFRRKGWVGSGPRSGKAVRAREYGGGGDSGSRTTVHLGGQDPRRAPGADALPSTAAPGAKPLLQLLLAL